MQTTTIYYFSATGNSLVVARGIAEKLGNTRLVSMAHKDAESPSPDCHRVGLVFPVYAFGMPLIARRFVKKLKVAGDTYLFAVAVDGGMTCATVKQAQRLFSKQGLLLSSGFAVTMVDNYTPLGGAMPPEKQKVRFEKAARKVDEICAAIEQRRRYIYPGWPLVNWLFSGLMYPGWVKNASGDDRKFAPDSNCNGCGICEKVCPVANIQMRDHLPAWQHRCEQCFACLHWCPVAAIQYGKHTARPRTVSPSRCEA